MAGKPDGFKLSSYIQIFYWLKVSRSKKTAEHVHEKRINKYYIPQ